MKLFISADMEGTAGIAHWDETNIGSPGYDHFARQMSLEVAAACEGALEAGCDDILVRDAHDSSRNINPALLPEQARIFRGGSRHPYIMMAGLDESFDGVAFTGYHSPSGSDANPLAHTMNRNNHRLTINGMPGSELLINCLTAAYLNVPVRLVTGDKALCEWISSVNPNIVTVPVSEGFGNGSISIHPDLSVRRIREAASRAMRQSGHGMMFPLPRAFDVEVAYRQHFSAQSASFYPGVARKDAHTVAFHFEDYFEVLRCLYFIF